MKSINSIKIIGVDHGYGNCKHASGAFPTGITAYDSKPNKPTSEQTAFIEKMQGMNCIAGVVYSVSEAMQLCGYEKIFYKEINNDFKKNQCRR